MSQANADPATELGAPHPWTLHRSGVMASLREASCHLPPARKIMMMVCGASSPDQLAIIISIAIGYGLPAEAKRRVRPVEQECSMLCHVLAGDLERDVRIFAKRHCKPGEYLVYRDQRGEIVAAFKSKDRAALFLNLFDEEIVRTFEDDIKRSAA